MTVREPIWITRFDSVSARIFSVLLLGMIGATALTSWLAFGERQNTINHERSNYRAERLKNSEQLIRAIDALPATNRTELIRAMPRLGLQETSIPSTIIPYSPESHHALLLIERLSPSYKIIPVAPNADNCFMRPDSDRPISEMCEALIIVLRDGSAIKQTIFPMRSQNPPIQRETIFYLLLFLGCIGGLAYFVSRMTISPLQRLSNAAMELGHDINRPPLLERGAKEILQATRAFNAMQLRIRSHIQQRTQMLAAITHDLQTPLTRLRLRLEKVNDQELREKLVCDLLNMQVMIKEGLDLARSMDNCEALRPLDIDSLLDSICNDAVDAGHPVSFNDKSKLYVMAQPQALRRCLNNLIDNAIKYGQQATIKLERTQEEKQAWLHILVQDKGPGLANNQINRVFDPFYRVESSRSRETGGTGLGLTIAQNIVRQHNGKITLRNLPEGGLEVRLSLPVKS